MSKPRIAITMGDPAGVGPELCLKLLATPSVRERCTPIIFGSAHVLAQASTATGVPPATHVIPASEWASTPTPPETPTVVDLPTPNGEVTPGKVTAASGQAAYEYITCAIDAAQARRVAAVTTAPIHKEAFRAAGVPFPGHTELFAARTGAARSCMMLTSDELTCSLVTTHVGYDEVPPLLTTERILEVIELSHDAMTRIRGRDARLAVCALNCHAGEHGLFGKREEERIILPAVEAARASGMAIAGPLPPDTAFLPARRREVDCFVCMYHDQGLIPLKALAFDSGVNITLGLPIIRTSVDHGTALDIAWQGIASASSLIEAVSLATRLASP